MIAIQYRPEQPNWEFRLCTVWKSSNFFAALFLVKSILADFRNTETVILTILEALNFDFWKYFTLENVKSIQILKIQSCSNGQNGLEK